MKILIITGRLAEGIVRERCKDIKEYDIEIYVANVDVAAFITPKHIKNLELGDYDLVLVPGLTAGAKWEELEREKGVTIRLGPIHAYDIPYVLKNIEKIQLSHKIPACKLIESIKAEEILKEVESIDDFIFEINGVKIGGNSRMKIVAEIVNATELGRDELINKINYYLESGADIIDLGIPLEYETQRVKNCVKIAKDYCDVISIDTFSPKAIKAGIDSGADMVMSISLENFKAIQCIQLKERAIVVVERDINLLRSLVNLVKKYTDKVIADPILEIPNIIDSLIRYKRYREMDSTTPILFGTGNVTELMDADSIGINAVLAYIAEEIGVDLLFTTETSPKTKGCIKELYYASFMVKGAKMRKTPPKDLGLSLLVLKDKVKYPEIDFTSNLSFIEAEEEKKFVRDPKGDFKIWLAEGKIVCSHEKLNIVGKDAKSIFDTILKAGLVSRLDHASYLGRELKKAEIALKLGKNYTQDQELNFGIYN